MKILLIGGCGYIGNVLYDNLCYSHWVDTIDLGWFGNFRAHNDRYPNAARDYGSLTPEEIQRYDALVVVAAHSSVPMCQEDPHGAFENNVVNFHRLLKNMRHGQKLLYASSSCVYTGTPGKATEETPLRAPCDFLTLTKSTIDQYAMLSDVEFYGLRFGSVAGYSPNLRSDLMVNAMTLHGMAGKVQVTNGSSHRPILGMRDLCRVVQKILNCAVDKRGIYNIASFNTSIMSMGVRVAELTKATLDVGPDEGGYDFKMDSGKFCEAFEFQFAETPTSIVRELIESTDKPGFRHAGRSARLRYPGV